MKTLIIALILISTPTLADQAIPIKAGEPAKFDGTLLDKEKADKLKDQLIERDEFERLNNSYEKSVSLYKANETIYQQENTLLLSRNVELSKELNSSRSTSTLEAIGYILLGAAGIYGASRLTR